MSDESMQTHLIAVLVGVLVTLFIVNSFQKKGKSESSVNDNNSGVSAGGGKSKKKKKKKKSKAQGSETLNDSPTDTSSLIAEANETDKEVLTTAEQEAAPVTKSNKKKKKKKSKTNEVKKTVVANESTENKENEQINGKKQEPAVAPKRKPKKPKQSQEDDGGWIVEAPKKKKNRSNQKQRTSPSVETKEVAAPVVNSSETVVIDARKVGIIIGPKGSTMKAIEEATKCKLEVNAPKRDEDAKPKFSSKPQTAAVVLTGDKDAVKKAKKAIKELDTKGYASILQADGFGESSITMHPRYLSEIVGPGGRTIKALQDTLDIKVTIPSTNWKPGNNRTVGISSQQVDMARVGLAGSKENVKKAKEVIKSLMREHHHEITHPGMIHEYVYVPVEFFHCIIGPRGSEIKHIKGNYKVEVYMPNNDQFSPATTHPEDEDSVLVVGKRTNVDRAISHIHNLMERDTEQKERKYNDEDF